MDAPDENKVSESDYSDLAVTDAEVNRYLEVLENKLYADWVVQNLFGKRI
jgi:hypothetical protein